MRRLFRLSVNTISADLDWFSVRLLTRDHASILLISRSRLSILQAGITRYVSSAYFTIMFPSVTTILSQYIGDTDITTDFGSDSYALLFLSKSKWLTERVANLLVVLFQHVCELGLHDGAD